MLRTKLLLATTLLTVVSVHALPGIPPGSNTMVQFQTTSNSVSETDGLTQLSVDLFSPDPFNGTSVDVVLVSGDATRVDNYTTETVSWPANDASSMFVNITLTDNGDCDGDAVLVFELQNATGGSGAIVGPNDQFTLTITDDDILVDSDNDAIPDCVDPCPLAVDGIANFNTVTCNCDPGYYQQTTLIGANTVITGCTECPAGTYCPDGIQSIPCPAGRYSDQPGQSACALCAAGTFNPTLGATSCQACQAGYFNATPGAVLCQPCDAGSFSASSGATSCQLCPPGAYSDVVGASSCQLCTAGTFNPVPGATECFDCPAGTFGDLPGQTECQDCAEGSFNPNPGASACQLCPPGAFSNVTGAVACQLCSSGTYNPIAGAIECIDCPIGTGSGVGAIECTPIGGCDNWTLTFWTDPNGGETAWNITEYGTANVLASGSGYSSNSMVTETICVPPGMCWDLTFTDSGNDGIPGGGWVLRDQNGDRVIDNTGNGGAFSSSATPGLPFCSPIGSDHLIFSSCDRMDWLSNEFIVASANPAVNAQWGMGDQTDDGYQFWFSDPVGGYDRRIFHSHAQSMGFGPSTATRACHMPLTWVTYPLPTNTLLNVRVRSRVNGVYAEFGPACRFQLLSAPPACPTTHLVNDPNNPNFSCGVTRTFGGSDKVVAAPLVGATHYKFRFVNIGEGFIRNIAGTSPARILNWVTLPLEDGVDYDVTVATSFDGGTTYCPFGEVCVVTINGAPAPIDNDNDGYTSDVDCNDNDPQLNPADVDMDGYSSCMGDCDDNDPFVFPGSGCASVDSDNDGLFDEDETNVFGTDPFDPDTDGGGVNDGTEVLVDGTDPLDPADDLVTPGPGARNMRVNTVQMTLWPNPNRGDQLFLALNGLAETQALVKLDLFDIYGQRVLSRQLQADQGAVNGAIDLEGQLAPGMYMVNIAAGDRHFTERLVIE
ncbi:MAG: T9SS type A sorting domain-containing protein [Flavobacteriales bacterium]|nr:T9SS type A sorting domain-containing protein [Flavobacteriales bacterium]